VLQSRNKKQYCFAKAEQKPVLFCEADTKNSIVLRSQNKKQYCVANPEQKPVLFCEADTKNSIVLRSRNKKQYCFAKPEHKKQYCFAKPEQKIVLCCESGTKNSIVLQIRNKKQYCVAKPEKYHFVYPKLEPITAQSLTLLSSMTILKKMHCVKQFINVVVYNYYIFILYKRKNTPSESRKKPIRSHIAALRLRCIATTIKKQLKF
jgi:hypothetical protein